LRNLKPGNKLENRGRKKKKRQGKKKSKGPLQTGSQRRGGKKVVKGGPRRAQPIEGREK